MTKPFLKGCLARFCLLAYYLDFREGARADAMLASLTWNLKWIRPLLLSTFSVSWLSRVTISVQPQVSDWEAEWQDVLKHPQSKLLQCTQMTPGNTAPACAVRCWTDIGFLKIGWEMEESKDANQCKSSILMLQTSSLPATGSTRLPVRGTAA